MKNIKLTTLCLAAAVSLGACSSAPTKENNTGSNTPSRSCEERETMAKNAFRFGAHNFHKGYGESNDWKGAAAQLFLIENKGGGSFSDNYNAAEESYSTNLKAAQESGCDTSKYPISPISAFRRGVEVLRERAK